MAEGSLKEYFLNRIQKTTNCWYWTGTKNPSGYGIGVFKKRRFSPHRISVELFISEIPKGMWIDHICRNKICANPKHLRIVTPRQNALENNPGIFATNKNKTHCINGHEFTPENTGVAKGYKGRPCRRCKTCSTRREQIYNMKRPPRRKAQS